MPLTTVPAVIISATTAIRPNVISRTSRRTSGRAGAAGSWQRTYSATVAATSAIDARKCTDTQPGFSLVKTTMPPSTAWTTIAPGWAAASQTRSARRPAARPSRNRQAATLTSTEITKMATVTSRLPNSIHRWISESPVSPPATRLRAVHSGQSGHPSPDWLSRTAAPVSTMAADAATPASAIRRMTAGEGASTRSATRRADQPRNAGRAA